MVVLVSANNMLGMFVGFEGIGICSYLLIGYWSHRLAASKSALKAIVVNRISDGLLLWSIIWLWWYTGSLEYDLILLNDSNNISSFISIALLLGCMAKIYMDLAEMQLMKVRESELYCLCMFYLIIYWYMFWAEPMSFVYSGLLFFNRHYSKRRPPSFPAVSGKQIIQDKEVISTIVGSLLGDASVHTQNKRGVNTSFSFAQSVIHVEYLLYLWEFFSGITSSVPPVVKELYNKSLNKTYYYVRFRTYTFSEFNFIRDMFYINKTYNENNVIVTKRVKIVPSNIGDYLTPLALAIWYMDDGS